VVLRRSAFKAKNYSAAITKYSEAIAADPTDVTFFSNRSACYAALNQWQEAAEDGRQCIIVDKSFVKGYFRHALALQNMANLDGALDSVKRGLGIDSTNADLKKMSRELEETMRVKKVEALIASADQQESSGDITGAYKTVDSALRLDPTSDILKKMMDRIKPKYERAEKARISTLDPKERLKEEGDTFFKNAQFEKAIDSYTKCLNAIPNKSGELALKVYNNRAACYKQLSNFDGTIEDSTNVLEHEPENVKALVRTVLLLHRTSLPANPRLPLFRRVSPSGASRTGVRGVRAVQAGAAGTCICASIRCRAWPRLATPRGPPPVTAPSPPPPSLHVSASPSSSSSPLPLPCRTCGRCWRWGWTRPARPTTTSPTACRCAEPYLSLCSLSPCRSRPSLCRTHLTPALTRLSSPLSLSLFLSYVAAHTRARAAPAQSRHRTAPQRIGLGTGRGPSLSGVARGARGRGARGAAT
jgi:stress-induced-phosphoprotein 1